MGKLTASWRHGGLQERDSRARGLAASVKLKTNVHESGNIRERAKANINIPQPNDDASSGERKTKGWSQKI